MKYSFFSYLFSFFYFYGNEEGVRASNSELLQRGGKKRATNTKFNGTPSQFVVVSVNGFPTIWNSWCLRCSYFNSNELESSENVTLFLGGLFFVCFINCSRRTRFLFWSFPIAERRGFKSGASQPGTAELSLVDSCFWRDVFNLFFL